MSKGRQLQEGDRRKEYLVDGVAVFFNLVGWVLAVWPPVIVLVANTIAVSVNPSAVRPRVVGISLAAGLLLSVGGMALIWFSRQLIARKLVRLGAAACLLWAALLITLIVSGAHRTAEQMANDITWVIVLVIVGGPLLSWRASAREGRRARS